MDIRIDHITNLLKVLTWNKIVQVTIIVIIAGTAYGLWENRVTVYNSLKVGVSVEIEEPLIVNISPGTKHAIETALSKTKGFILGIEIVNVDFKKNTRSIVFGSYTDENLSMNMDKFSKTRISAIPLFTERESSNQKIIDLINGEFTCQPYKDTILYTLIPAASETVETLCSISIPPYYGRFSGYMNIYMNRKLSVDDTIYIRQLLRDLSVRIYEIDIDRAGRYRY